MCCAEDREGGHSTTSPFDINTNKMSEASVLGVQKACTLHGKYSFTLTQKRLRSSWSAFCWCCRTPSYTYLSLHYKIFKLVYVSFYQVCAFEMAHCIFWSAFDAWGFHSTIYMVDSITHLLLLHRELCVPTFVLRDAVLHTISLNLFLSLSIFVSRSCSLGSTIHSDALLFPYWAIVFSCL